MNLRIRRRRFGQLAIATAATAAVANLAGKTVAQTPQNAILGVRLAAINTTNTPAPNPIGGIIGGVVDAVVDDVDDVVNIVVDAVRNTPPIAVISSDVETGREISVSRIATAAVDNLDSITDTLIDRAVSTLRPERITGLTALSDGSLIVASVGSTPRGQVSRLIITDSRERRRSVRVSGFPNPNGTVESILGTKDNRLFSIISLREGIPPFALVTIDLNTGRITAGEDLALPDLQSGARFSNLAQSPDGTIYGTTIGREGATSLVQLDLENRSVITGRGRIIKLPQFSFNNQPLENDLSSLAFSPSGQLFALGDPNSEGTNSLFNVDVRTGQLRLLRVFNVAKIAFALS